MWDVEGICIVTSLGFVRICIMKVVRVKYFMLGRGECVGVLREFEGIREYFGMKERMQFLSESFSREDKGVKYF